MGCKHWTFFWHLFYMLFIGIEETCVLCAENVFHFQKRFLKPTWGIHWMLLKPPLFIFLEYKLKSTLISYTHVAIKVLFHHNCLTVTAVVKLQFNFCLFPSKIFLQIVFWQKVVWGTNTALLNVQIIVLTFQQALT